MLTFDQVRGGIGLQNAHDLLDRAEGLLARMDRNDLHLTVDMLGMVHA